MFHLWFSPLRELPFCLHCRPEPLQETRCSPNARRLPYHPSPKGKPSQLLLHPGDKSLSSPFGYPAPIPIRGTFLISFTAVNKMLVALLDIASTPTVHSKGQSLPQHTLRSPR